MRDEILITQLNDFIFCPISIYFHNLYGDENVMSYQRTSQLNGTNAHKNVDGNTYAFRSDLLCGLDVYSEKYGLIGKIDQYNAKQGILTERKRTIKKIYDGYVFQIYAQYFALCEMGYRVKQLRLYSITDNKSYTVLKPEEDNEMFRKFEKLIQDMRTFQMEEYQPDNKEKCKNCIYETACDRSAYRRTSL